MEQMAFVDDQGRRLETLQRQAGTFRTKFDSERQARLKVEAEIYAAQEKVCVCACMCACVLGVCACACACLCVRRRC
jgi:hypothetical protein